MWGRVAPVAGLFVACLAVTIWSTPSAFGQDDSINPEDDGLGSLSERTLLQPHWRDLLSTGIWLEDDAGLRSREVLTIASSPSDPDHVYAGGRGFIYRSRDGGASWQVVHSLFSQGRSGRGERGSGSRRRISVSDIADLTDAQIDQIQDRFQELENDLFSEIAAESDEFTAALVVNGSQDDLLEQAFDDMLAAGELAEPEVLGTLIPPTEIPENLFTHILIDPADDSRILAASGRGLHLSANYGETWTQIYRGVGADARKISSIAFSRDRILLGTASGVYFSDDGGSSWNSGGGPPSRQPVRFVVTAPSDPSRLYLVADGRIHRSDDGGTTFNPTTRPSGLGTGDFRNIAVDPGDPDHVYLATRTGLWSSTDGGGRFARTGTVGLREPRLTWVTLVPGHVIVASLDGVYYSSDDGATWSVLNRGLTGSVTFSLTPSADANRLWAAGDRGVYELVEPDELEPREDLAQVAIDRWAFEPNLGQTVLATITYYNYDGIPLDGWRARIHVSRWLPTVRFIYDSNLSRRFTQDFIPGINNEAFLSDQNFRTEEDEEYRIQAQWDLMNIIFDTRELSAQQTAERLIRRRNTLVRRIIRAFDQRRTLLLRMSARRRTNIETEVTDELRLAELTARLDVFTGGYFSAFTSAAMP